MGTELPETMHETIMRLRRELHEAEQRIIESEERIVLLQQVVDRARERHNEIRRRWGLGPVPGPVPGRERQ